MPGDRDGVAPHVGISISGLTNTSRAATPTTTSTGRLCEFFNGATLEPQLPSEPKTWWLARSTPKKRYSFFRVSYRVAGHATTLGRPCRICTAVSSETQQAVYTYLRFEMPAPAGGSSRLSRSPAGRLRSGLYGRLWMLDPRITDQSTSPLAM